MSPCSSSAMKPRAWPTVGSRMSPRGSLGLGSMAIAQVVALLLDVGGHGVDALAVAVERGVDVLGAVVLGALAAAPHDEGLGAQLGGEVDVADHLAQAVAAHLAVVGGEGAVLEDRVAEGVGRDHLADDAGLVERLAEVADDPVALGVAAAEGHEVVVVEGDAPGAEVGEAAHGLDRVEVRARGVTELVTSLPADGPETERELVVRGGRADHGAPPRATAYRVSAFVC